MTPFLYSLIGFIVCILIAVLIHELGHFFMARLYNVGVEKVSVGFGPSILRYFDKKTGTLWCLSIIPLGGYVKLQEDDDSLTSLLGYQNMSAIPPMYKVLIAFAGPFANILFAFGIYSYIAFGQPTLAPQIMAPAVGTLAYNAGIAQNTTIKSVRYAGQDYTIESWQQFSKHLKNAKFSQQSLEITDDKQKTYFLPALQSSATQNAIFNPLNTQQNYGFMPVYSKVVFNLIDTKKSNKIAPNNFGLQANDELISLNQIPVTQLGYGAQIQLSSGEAVQATIKRANQLIVIDLPKDELVLKKRQEVQQIIDKTTANLQASQNGEKLSSANTLSLKDIKKIDLSNTERDLAFKLEFVTQKTNTSAFSASKTGLDNTFSSLSDSLNGFMNLLSPNNQQGNTASVELMGPIGIADHAGVYLQKGLYTFLLFVATINISLAAINLLPIPLLDGWHMLIGSIEAIIGKSFSKELLAKINQFAFTFLLTLLIFISLKDITNVFF